jgi:uncharacterized linocin/CFP29 family protein
MEITTDVQGFAEEMIDRSGYLIGGFSTPGERKFRTQQFLESGMDPKFLRTNATLNYDEWKQIDTAVMTEARTRAAIATDLQTRGLVHRLRNMGVTMSQYSRINAKERARVAMSVETQADRQRLDYDQVQVPVPIIYDEFRLDLRQLLASRNGGEALDTANARESGIVVGEEIERLIVSGASNIVVGGSGIPGLLTHANRNTISTSVDWGTPANIYDSVVAMIAAARGDRMFGPYVLYISNEQWTQTLSKEGVERFSNVQERVRQIPGIQDIKDTFALPDGTAVLLQLSPLVIDLAIAQNLATVQWEERGGWVVNFIVYAVMTPRVKATYGLRSGVTVHTGV